MAARKTRYATAIPNWFQFCLLIEVPCLDSRNTFLSMKPPSQTLSPKSRNLVLRLPPFSARLSSSVPVADHTTMISCNAKPKARDMPRWTAWRREEESQTVLGVCMYTRWLDLTVIQNRRMYRLTWFAQYRRYQQDLLGWIPCTLGMPRKQQPATLAMPTPRMEAQSLCLWETGMLSDSFFSKGYRTFYMTSANNPTESRKGHSRYPQGRSTSASEEETNLLSEWNIPRVASRHTWQAWNAPEEEGAGRCLSVDGVGVMERLYCKIVPLRYRITLLWNSFIF